MKIILMKQTIFHIFAVLILSFSIFAQNDDSRMIPDIDQTNMPLHSVLSTTCGSGYALAHYKDAKVLANIYGNNSIYFGNPYVIKAYIRSQWEYNCKLPAEKLLIQNCNVHQKDLRIRFFIVPQNVKIETCEENLIIPSESVLFEKLYFYPTKNTLYEKAIEDTFVDLYTIESQYSKTSIEKLRNMLNQSPESEIYLIGYLGTNLRKIPVKNKDGESIYKEKRKLDKSYQAEKILNNIQDILEKNGIESAEIKITKGGYREGVKHVEIWFVPKGGEIPKPKPDYFPKQKREK